MRLIDADKLIRTVRFLTLRDGKEIEIHYVEAERIDSAPTIEAVPVEFIRHWIHALNHGRRNGKVWAAMVLQALLDAWAREERREK